MAAAAAQRRQQQPVAAATVGGGGSGGPGIAMPAVGRKPSGELLPPPLSRPSLSGSQEPLQVQRRCNSITCASSAPPHKTADGSPGPAPGPANKSGAAPPLQPQPTLPPQPSPPPPPQPPASSSSGATTRLPALSLARSTTSGSAAGL
ncbi:hypothetical protein Agub_g7206 [Astrephomene gubernaculifera]|uniref:Uncharacterized protein n=1 Tax=Astrephomene gubernaculifera TaxID=47775 RepID=A0AAD3DPU0_9CHLO|nr:hypothetical protein Agub_g7206 [Astrephomene gubernaculifera]